MNSCCVVVIGHVDHGKTALVRALSGIETDQLPEEKARGLSIAAGYAHRVYEGGTIDFIDAPGHADFVQAMIAGATGARGALVVISATEGICAQTREHLSIAGLLGVSRAVVAVTKSDLVPKQERDAVLRDVRAGLVGGPIADAPAILCSAITGAGLQDLHTALGALLTEPDKPSAPTSSFLPIDRAFSLPGRGTIVTGTLLGGDLAVDDTVILNPAGRPMTIRGLESRGTARDVVHAGERVAVNLRGTSVTDVARGDVLCRAQTAAATECIDVRLTVLSSASKPIRHMEELRISFGTRNAVASVRLFGGGQRLPGETAFAQLRFKRPVTGFAGQRAILRRLSPPETIGGAAFLDPAAIPTRAGDRGRITVLGAIEKGDITAIAQALSASGDGTLRVSDAARLARIPEAAARAALQDCFIRVGSDRIAPRARIEAAEAAVLGALAAYHAEHPVQAMAPQGIFHGLKIAPALLTHIVAGLCDAGVLHTRGGKVALANHDPIALLGSEQRAALGRIETAFRDAGLSTPTASDTVLVDLLVDTGKLVRLRNVALKQTLLLHADTLSAAAATLRAALPPPQPFTTSQARTALGTTRRIIVPLLEHFDKAGMTVRDGNIRQIADVYPVSPSQPPC